MARKLVDMAEVKPVRSWRIHETTHVIRPLDHPWVVAELSRLRQPRSNGSLRLATFDRLSCENGPSRRPIYRKPDGRLFTRFIGYSGHGPVPKARVSWIEACRVAVKENQPTAFYFLTSGSGWSRFYHGNENHIGDILTDASQA